MDFLKKLVKFFLDMWLKKKETEQVQLKEKRDEIQQAVDENKANPADPNDILSKL